MHNSQCPSRCCHVKVQGGLFPLVLRHARLSLSIFTFDLIRGRPLVCFNLVFLCVHRWLLAPNATVLARSSGLSVFCWGANRAPPAWARYLAYVLRCFVFVLSVLRTHCVQCTVTGHGLIHGATMLCPHSGSNAITMSVRNRWAPPPPLYGWSMHTVRSDLLLDTRFRFVAKHPGAARTTVNPAA